MTWEESGVNISLPVSVDAPRNFADDAEDLPPCPVTESLVPDMSRALKGGVST